MAKVVFVATECENYAIMQFSTLLKERGHTVYLVFDPRLFNNDDLCVSFLGRMLDIRKENIKKIKQIKPDFVMFSTYTQDYQYNLSFVRMIKKEVDTQIVFGGIHCILCSEQVAKEECVDWVCASEGEDVVIDLCEYNTPSDQFKLAQNILSQPYLTDISSLPFPDRKLFYDQKPLFKRDYTISTSRGCPYHCAFCASEALNKKYNYKYLRQRTPQHVINELVWAKQFNYKSVVFTDDNMVMNTGWLKEFLSDYKRYIDKPFCCTSNPHAIKDEQIFLLKDAGCELIGFGIQSCNEKTRKEILHRYGTNQRIMDVARLCHRLGIRFSVDHIFNIPGFSSESRTCQDEAVELYNETKPTVIHTFNMTYLPKIELNKYLDDKTRQEVEEGKIRTCMFLKNNDYYATLFMFIPLFPKWVIRLLAKLKLRFPFWVRLLLKDIARLKGKRYSETFFPIKLLFINIIDNVRIKCSKE